MINEIDKLIEEGNILENEKKYDLAIEKFKLALNKSEGTDYDIGWFYLVIAEQYLNKKDFASALKNYSLAEKDYKSKNKYFINYRKGDCLYQQKDYLNARLELLKSAIILKEEYKNDIKDTDYVNRMLDILKLLSKNEEACKENINKDVEQKLNRKYDKNIKVFCNGILFNDKVEYHIISYKRKLFGKNNVIIYSNDIVDDLENFGSITKEKLIKIMNLNINDNWNYLEIIELNDLCFSDKFTIKVKSGNDINYFIK